METERNCQNEPAARDSSNCSKGVALWTTYWWGDQKYCKIWFLLSCCCSKKAKIWEYSSRNYCRCCSWRSDRELLLLLVSPDNYCNLSNANPNSVVIIIRRTSARETELLFTSILSVDLILKTNLIKSPTTLWTTSSLLYYTKKINTKWKCLFNQCFFNQKIK